MKNKNDLILNHHHQISLPHEICQQLDLKPGDELWLDKQGDLLIVQPKPQNIVHYLAGLHKDTWENIDPQKYLHKERNTWIDSDI